MKSKLAFLCGALVGIALSVSIIACLDREKKQDCDQSSESRDSPDGTWRAQMVTNYCDRGFGISWKTASMTVARVGPNGWTFTFKLEQEVDDRDPEFHWTAPATLEVVIPSRVVTGILEARLRDGLKVIRTYVIQ